jgi:hypothetical protein
MRGEQPDSVRDLISINIDCLDWCQPGRDCGCNDQHGHRQYKSTRSRYCRTRGVSWLANVVLSNWLYIIYQAFCINLSRPGTHVTFSAALFSAEYLTTARSSTVLPHGLGLIVKQTRMHDLHEPNDRVEVARYVSGITRYLTHGGAKIGRIQKIIRDAKRSNL